MPVDPRLHFSASYLEARARMHAAAKARGAHMSAYALGTRSDRSEELTVDCAYLGPEAPARVVALSSGLHGVEGFAGSAIQHRLLAEQLDGLEPGSECGLLVVHALNPFGFSALRRVNERNVDLNRNFLQHPEGHVPNPGYEELYDAINPEHLDEESDDGNRRRILAYAEQHGFAKLQEVLTVGQYVHPEGVQFGGSEPEESNRLLREIAVRETRGAAQVVWLDLHTGLGDWGGLEIISEWLPDDPHHQRAQALWGDRVRSTVSGESVSAAVHGSIEMGLDETLAERELTAVAAEFGTYDPARVFAAMRADNWLHRYGRIETEQGAAIQREIVEVFRPDSVAWQAAVLETGARLIQETLGA